MSPNSFKRNHTRAFGTKTAFYTTAIVVASLQQAHSESIPPLYMRLPSKGNLLRRGSGSLPLTVTNNCTEQVCPAINTQEGQGPTPSGFCLQPGNTQNLTVSPDWQGRVWARTNCSFPNPGAPNPACMTGDCAGALECSLAGQPPVTLAEFTIQGSGSQTFFDISIVDGFNIGVGIVVMPNGVQKLQSIPPNKTNPSCVASIADFQPNFNPYLNQSAPTFLGTNSSWPLPFLTSLTTQQLSRWCPWDLQEFPPQKPGDGIYPYPDDNIQRPAFQPCFSTCAKYNAPKDCCTGHYNSPSTCKPGLYSQNAKTVCPDAYTYAYDDTASTFAVPMGGGFQVIFCPAGVSTNIIASVSGNLARSASQSFAYSDRENMLGIYAIIALALTAGLFAML